MIAAPAVVAQVGRLDGIQQWQILMAIADEGVGIGSAQAPPAVPTPGIEGAVVAGLEHGIEDIAPLDDMAAPAAIADVDPGARHAIDGAIAHRDA